MSIGVVHTAEEHRIVFHLEIGDGVPHGQFRHLCNGVEVFDEEIPASRQIFHVSYRDPRRPFPDNGVGGLLSDSIPVYECLSLRPRIRKQKESRQDNQFEIVLFHNAIYLFD